MAQMQTRVTDQVPVRAVASVGATSAAATSVEATSAAATSVDAIDGMLRALLEQLPTVPGTAAEASSAIEAVERIGRLVDAARVRVLIPLVGDPNLVNELGYASATAAVAALASIKEASARNRMRVATSVTPFSSLAGAILPPSFDAVESALMQGTLGLDAAAVIVGELAPLTTRVDRDKRDCAEAAMVRIATGLDATGERCATSVSVDFLATELHSITCAIDPDGARPREQRAIRRRELRLGAEDADGLIPLHGRLLPETGLLLAALLESHRRSPRFTSDPHPVDSDALDSDTVDSLSNGSFSFGDDRSSLSDNRTRAQRHHDAFADALNAAAASADSPNLDGAPITVLVTVTASDLQSADGLDGDPIATMADSTQPISRLAVERFVDAYGYRAVHLDAAGAVTGISSIQRCFTSSQRKAIAARDGARCASPGCTSPHYMLQAHHVVPVREHGETTTSNGILLCFWHHLQVDTGPWQYRMVQGITHARRGSHSEWMPIRMPRTTDLSELLPIRAQWR